MADLEAPEIDVDDEDPTFKRIVAIVVVAITFFGSVVAYWQAVESNDEDNAARDAQIFAIEGLARQVDSSAELGSDLGIAVSADILAQLEAVNAQRVAAFGDDESNAVFTAERDRYQSMREVVSAQGPVDFADNSTFVDQSATLGRTPDEARLTQLVEADKANDHGSKADSFVAVLTVLAVALFLVGLSLTVEGRSRAVLVVPGCVIAVACVGWSLAISRQPVTEVDETSVFNAALGLQRLNAGDVEGALDSYDAAIEASPDFGVAYSRRADAHFLSGATSVGRLDFVSVTSEDALDRALEDIDRALELGGDTDQATLGQAGFYRFLAEDFEESADLSRRSLDANDEVAPVWFNLGVALVAQGDEDGAIEAYQSGLDVLERRADLSATSIVAGARTDLSILRTLLDDDALEDRSGLIEEVEVLLAAFDFGCRDDEAEPCGFEAAIDDGASVVDAEVFRNARQGPFVFASVTLDGVPAGTEVGVAWYLRTDDDFPFQQANTPFLVDTVGDDGVLSASGTLPSALACPVGGEYLVRLYAGERFLGEATGTIDPSPFGETFTQLTNLTEGFQACLPEGAQVQELDVGVNDRFTSIGSDVVSMAINVTPGFLLDFQEPDELEEQSLAALLGGESSEPVPIILRGRDADGGFVDIEGLAAFSPDDAEFGAAAAVAVGADGTARVVLVNSSNDPAVLDEAVGLVEFINVVPDPA